MITEDLSYTRSILEEILNIPSPSGFCTLVMNRLEEEVIAMGFEFERTRKGNGLVTLPVYSDVPDDSETLLVSAHVDTLGAMVRSIKTDGRIRMTSVGGFTMHSVEGEYCTVHTRAGHGISGTILSTMPSVHVYSEARTQERKEEAMEIRLDRDVDSKETVEALGIMTGDYISFDPRVRMSEEGYIKSRHLDDKAGVAVIMGALQYVKQHGICFDRKIQVMFSTYEEVGHGSSYIPEDVDMLLAVDMGAIGDDLACTEKDVSICVKDSTGPYDYEIVGELVEIAKEQELAYALDVYPSYGSDASAALRGGHNIRTALIGPECMPPTAWKEPMSERS